MDGQQEEAQQEQQNDEAAALKAKYESVRASRGEAGRSKTIQDLVSDFKERYYEVLHIHFFLDHIRYR